MTHTQCFFFIGYGYAYASLPCLPLVTVHANVLSVPHWLLLTPTYCVFSGNPFVVFIYGRMYLSIKSPEFNTSARHSDILHSSPSYFPKCSHGNFLSATLLHSRHSTQARQSLCWSYLRPDVSVNNIRRRNNTCRSRWHSGNHPVDLIHGRMYLSIISSEFHTSACHGDILQNVFSISSLCDGIKY